MKANFSTAYQTVPDYLAIISYSIAYRMHFLSNRLVLSICLGNNRDNTSLIHFIAVETYTAYAIMGTARHLHLIVGVQKKYLLLNQDLGEQ